MLGQQISHNSRKSPSGATVMCVLKGLLSAGSFWERRGLAQGFSPFTVSFSLFFEASFLVSRRISSRPCFTRVYMWRRRGRWDGREGEKSDALHFLKRPQLAFKTLFGIFFFCVKNHAGLKIRKTQKKNISVPFTEENIYR